MKSAPFTYARPDAVEQAAELLAEYGDDAKALAGGQSLLAMMNLRVAQPSVLVDLAGCGLAGISVAGDLRVGAMTTQTAALRSGAVAAHAPLLSRALQDVGHHALRNRGTIGGSVAHADPAAEVPAALLALGGRIDAVGPNGARRIAADDFFVSHYTTALADDEVITSLTMPARAPDAWAFHELGRRHGDYAVAGVAAAFALGAGATISAARVVLFALADRPLRAAAAEQALLGRALGDREAIAAAAQAAAEAVDPVGDLHGGRDYRRRMAAVVVRRGLAAATKTTGEAA